MYLGCHASVLVKELGKRNCSSQSKLKSLITDAILLSRFYSAKCTNYILALSCISELKYRILCSAISSQRLLIYFYYQPHSCEDMPVFHLQAAEKFRGSRSNLGCMCMFVYFHV